MSSFSSLAWKAAALLVALGLPLLAGLVSYGEKIPTSISDTTTQTDAIVALTGGSGRINAGIDLLGAGMANHLFVSGTGPQVSVEDLVKSDHPNRNALIDQMSIGAEAEDTSGNATETAAWARNNDITSIRLVTAAYHMPRSLLEFTEAMPEIAIIPHPVFPTQVKMDWWRHPGSAGLLGREYLKYLLASARLWVTDILDTKESNKNGATLK